MPSLGAKQRARLPNSAFAYIDSKGRRLLPIHDEAHLRNALARFSRVSFEDEAARDRARMRLLKAAKKLGIIPLGFVGGQLRPEQKLPRGRVTFLLADIEGSTDLVHKLGDGYSPVLNHLRRLMRAAVQKAGGREVEAVGDEILAVFERARSAVDAAVAFQRAIRRHAWGDEIEPRVRIGIHTGHPTLAESGYLGIAVHTVARVSTAAHGGQIAISSTTREAISTYEPGGIALKDLGSWHLRGLKTPMALYQVLADELLEDFPPVRAAALPASR